MLLWVDIAKLARVFLSIVPVALLASDVERVLSSACFRIVIFCPACEKREQGLLTTVVVLMSLR
jgi:hypothetical protein